MALRQGWAVNSVSIDAPDARLAMAGLLVRDTSHQVRSGVFSTKVRTLAAGRSDMRLDVAQFNAVFTRGAQYGAVLFSNDATAQVVIDAAPTSNSRIDVVYVLIPDSSQGETAAAPSFQVAKGTASASPQRPSLPAAAFELATVVVPSTATSTNSADVIITQTFRFTSVMGGRIPFRALATVQGETSLYEGTLALLDATIAGTPVVRTYRYDGSSWRLWEQPPTVASLSQSSAGFNLGSLGSTTFVVTVAAGQATVDFRLRAAGNNISWGDIRYNLPFPAFDVFGTTQGMSGTADINDDTGGSYQGAVGLMADGTWRVWRTGADNGASASWAGSQPFTIGPNDTITGKFTYPVA